MPRFLEGSTKRWLWRKESFGQGGTGETETNMAGWKMDPVKMSFLLNMVIFHCYVSLPEGIKHFR